MLTLPKLALLSLTTAALLALAGRLSAAEPGAVPVPSPAANQEQVANVLEQMQAAMQRDQRYYQELFKRQGVELQAFAEAIRQLDGEVVKLRQRVAALEAENARLRPTPPPAESPAQTPPQPPPTIKPEVSPAPSPGAGVASPGPRRHLVVEGDTLTSIAKAAKLSVAALKAANKLESDTIRLGQVLIIPEP